jgi:hypothetical protein
VRTLLEEVIADVDSQAGETVLVLHWKGSAAWFWDSVGCRTDGLELSLKLYHVCDLRLGHQQSVTEAPNYQAFG